VETIPLGSIGDIAIVMPNRACSHAQGSPQGLPFFLAVPVCSGAPHRYTRGRPWCRTDSRNVHAAGFNDGRDLASRRRPHRVPRYGKASGP
jgi:hypothetical protein